MWCCEYVFAYYLRRNKYLLVCTYLYICMYLYKSHFNSHHVVLTVNSLTVISAGVDYLPQRANKY